MSANNQHKQKRSLRRLIFLLLLQSCIYKASVLLPIPDKKTQRSGMRRFLFILILMTCMPISIQALRLGTSSEYRNGSFYTSVVCLVDAPYAKVSSTLDEVDAGMKESPTKSIPWAWRNLGQLKNPDENDLRLSENGVSYDETTSASKL